MIQSTGPLSVSEYMITCLADHEAGYYMTREPFGRDGDFITAPDVSQMFGELIGVWCVAAWQALGKPRDAVLCEIGPGRGTLMQDVLRTATKLAPDFIASARIAMVETSPRLAKIQQDRLANAAPHIGWHQDFTTIGAGPLILVANELFDALPIRQFVKTKGQFSERVITLDDQDELIFASSATGIDITLLPKDHASVPDGTVFEIAPARSALMQTIAERIIKTGGSALLIDYGHLVPGFGDTLQAMIKHRFDDVFAHPGDADLTSHVDFAALAQTARQAGCVTAMSTQGDFLITMGLLDRAGQLGSGKDASFQDQLRADVERLAGPDQMGSLFKVMGVSDPQTRLFPFDVA